MKAWGDLDDLPFQAGNRVITLAFSPVLAIYNDLRLTLSKPRAFQELCTNLCLAATPAAFDPDVNAVLRRPNEIGAAFAKAVSSLDPLDAEMARTWVLQGHNGGAAGPDPRYFWKAAIAWAADAPSELGTDKSENALVVTFALECMDDISDPDWPAKVDAVLSAPYGGRDIEVGARLRTGLLQDAAVGDAINPISIHLEPVRAWRIIEAHWRASTPETQAAVDKLPWIWAETAGQHERSRGGPVQDALCPFKDVLADV